MRALSLTEWTVLALAAEGTTHGFDLARQLDQRGPIGRIWTVRRPLVYRAIDVLVAEEALAEVGTEEGHGPRRRLLEVTTSGRREVDRWLLRPVAHVREVRTELLVKLALLERAGVDPSTLVQRQREVFVPQLAGLRLQLDASDGFDTVLARWRVESALAVERFLGSL